MKPPLSEEQKQKFETAFRQLMYEAPKEVQDKWNGQTIWSPTGEPMFEGGIQHKLKGKLADKYVTLLNKLNDRRI